MPELRAVIQESWSRAVLAASSVEEQAQELVTRLGSALSDAPLSPEHAKTLLAEVSQKLHEHRQQLQVQVEQTVRRGLERLRLPAKNELRDLSQRLEQLEARLAGLEGRHGQKEKQPE